MAIQLDSIVLNPNLVWSDRDSWSPVQQTAKRTLGGKMVLNAASLDKGRPITLTSLDDQGWVKWSEVQALKLLADQAGAVFNLTLGSDTFNVVFRHHEPPALEVTPFIQRVVPEVGDYFLVSIKLITV